MSTPEKFKIEDQKEKIIQCSDCNKPLFVMRQFITSDNISQKYRADCPACGGNTFVITANGEIFIGPITADHGLGYNTIIENIDLNNSGIWDVKLLIS